MAVLTMVVAIFGFGAAAAAQGTISRDALKEGLAKGTHVLVDVREPDEYVAGHVPGASNLPLSRFDPAALPNDGRTVVLMCRSGARSGTAQSAAARAGRPTLNYVGSMLDWTAYGEPVIRGASAR